MPKQWANTDKLGVQNAKRHKVVFRPRGHDRAPLIVWHRGVSECRALLDPTPPIGREINESFILKWAFGVSAV
jgi:hypothetical protein